MSKKPLKEQPGRASRDIERQQQSQMALNRANFICMAIAGAMIVVGFLLMLGPSSTADAFEPDIFSTRRIVVGPTIAFLGFLAMAIAIIVPFKNKKG
ncbi:MAG: DUF3098 domain-containing protein [Muribaculaceae bacterium]|nr:DUF3098 domain-containing protein [Muribaculaceae bacterium]